MIRRHLNFLVIASIAIVSNVTAQKLPVIQQPSFKKDTFNIVKYGAVADGITLNTKSINDAIVACSNKGGGIVLVPGGFWLTGPIEMKSNVNLHVRRDAILQFTNDLAQYKLVEGNWEGQPNARNQSPISGKNLQNIAITGGGIIDGWGDAWRMVKKDKLTSSQWKNLVESGGVLSDDKKIWYPSAQSLKGSQMKDAGVLKNGKTINDFEDIKNFLRPNLLVLESCKKVLLEGVTFQNSPAWCLHPLMCEDLTVRNVYAKNPWYAQNGDGIDVESCNRVLIENSTFDVGDDGICIKSGKDESGRKRGMPTQNAIIRNCIVYHAHGGFVIGSEMSGGAKNIYVSDCSFIGTDIGLRFKTTRGRGGVVANINVSNINMKDISGEAILFDMYYEAKDPVPLAGEVREAPKVELLPVTEATPQFKNFNIKNVVCNGASKAIFVRGLPEMHIKDISLQDVIITAKKGIEIEEATGITMKNIRLSIAATDALVNIQNSRQISFDNLKTEKATDVIFNVAGSECENIQYNKKSTIPYVKQVAAFNFGATEKSLIVN